MGAEIQGKNRGGILSIYFEQLEKALAGGAHPGRVISPGCWGAFRGAADQALFSATVAAQMNSGACAGTKIKVIEFGSGLSTTLIRLTYGPWINHVAIDQNKRWAHPSAIISPIKGGWYSWRPAEDETPFDVILIDGPAGSRPRNGIMPHLPAMVGEFTHIIMDDSTRPTESAMVQKICRIYGFVAEFGHSGKRGWAWMRKENR